MILRKVAEAAGVPLQEFEVRNDMACGSTIGPLISKMGLRTVDIGCVQLSMHSIRETGMFPPFTLPKLLLNVDLKLMAVSSDIGGAEDVGMLIKLFKQFFKDFAKVDKSVILDD